MNETLAHGYSSESPQLELSKEYQHDRVYMGFKYLCVLVLWVKVASELKGSKHEYQYKCLELSLTSVRWIYDIETK